MLITQQDPMDIDRRAMRLLEEQRRRRDELDTEWVNRSYGKVGPSFLVWLAPELLQHADPS